MRTSASKKQCPTNPTSSLGWSADPSGSPRNRKEIDMSEIGKPRCFSNWSTPGAELCALCRHDRDCLDATDSYSLAWMISAPKCFREFGSFSEFGSVLDCRTC